MLLNLLLQADVAEESDFSFIVLLGGMFLIMYFFMIRPQMKRQKEAKTFRESISKGDKVVTIGGLHGKVLSVSDLTVMLELEQGKVRIDKTAVSPKGGADEADIELQKNS
ncbi:MAG: preprotein translocase subunit YajC [Bacteroidetes bacterium]|nr:MAG: preprotein translocase subunit YajC [Bacteroidota bacterium]